MVWCGDGAESQATPGSRLVGLARDGEGVGSVEEICEGTAGEEGTEQSGPRDAEREEVSMASPYMNNLVSRLESSINT